MYMSVSHTFLSPPQPYTHWLYASSALAVLLLATKVQKATSYRKQKKAIRCYCLAAVVLIVIANGMCCVVVVSWHFRPTRMMVVEGESIGGWKRKYNKKV